MPDFNLLLVLTGLLGLTAYSTAVYQMLIGTYSPSFFSRGVWFLLGINSFIGVYLGGGSDASIVLAATLLLGNTAVFLASYKKGSREFGSVEKISLVLLFVATFVWLVLDAPFITLVISLMAHLIGGLPTIWRTLKNPESEQAWHWYFFFAGAILSIFASPDKTLTAILFPAYFAVFDGLIIFLANRKRFQRDFG